MFSFLGRKWPDIPFDEVRKRARLLVVDDTDFPYQKLFVRDGYTIEKWDDIKELSELENGAFDLILLDLQGVGRQESADQGLGVLRHLRDRCPAQIIVVYSNADWGLQFQDHLHLADAVLPKSADYVTFKARVDSLLRDRFSLGFYIARIKSEAKDPGIDLAKVEAIARRGILRRDLERLRGELRQVVTNAKTVDRILSIANAAIGILQLWKG